MGFNFSIKTRTIYLCCISNTYGNYNRFRAGKYLNEYGIIDEIGESAFDVPQGWNSWYSLAGQILFYDYCQSNNGKQECYGNNPNEYHTTVIKNHAIDFLKQYKENKADTPFLLVFSSIACHSPFTVEDKYKGIDDGQISPRTANWNYVVPPDGKHHALLKAQTQMTPDIIKQSDQIYSWRLGTLRSVDDAIGEIYDYIENELDEIDNTYFIYTSDHGYHNGQWAMSFSQMQLYETDVRVQFYINGPNIKTGTKTNIFATTIDIAPTILDIAGIDINEIDDGNQMDGKSLLKYAVDSDDDDAEELNGDQVFLVEYNGMGMNAHEWMGIQSNIEDLMKR